MVKLIVFLLAVLVVNAKSDDDCSTYFKHMSAEYDKCLSSEVDVSEVVHKLSNVAIGEATVDEYQATVNSFCGNFKDVPECLDKAPVEKSACYYDESIQNFRNALKSFAIINKYGCANNGKRFLDMADEDGPKCYSLNKEYGDCFNSTKATNELEDSQTYLDDFICKAVKAEAECLIKYGSCSNKNVNVFVTELNEAAKIAFKCN